MYVCMYVCMYVFSEKINFLSNVQDMFKKQSVATHLGVCSMQPKNKTNIVTIANFTLQKCMQFYKEEAVAELCHGNPRKTFADMCSLVCCSVWLVWANKTLSDETLE